MKSTAASSLHPGNTNTARVAPYLDWWPYRNGSGFPHASDLTWRKSHTKKEGYIKELGDRVKARGNLAFVIAKVLTRTTSKV